MNTFKNIEKIIKSIFIIFLFLLNIAFSNAQLTIGNKIPEISLKDNTDSSINLLSLTGKVLLIDFWASWCGPCRKANKKLVTLYKEFGGENFEIVGISLDTDRAKWLKAIAKDNIKYIQLIDPYGFDANSALQFGVEALPASYLVDTTGIIIAINPTEQQIKKQLNHFKQ